MRLCVKNLYWLAKFWAHFKILLVQQKSDKLKCNIIPNPAKAAALVLNIRNFVMFIMSQTNILLQCPAYMYCGLKCIIVRSFPLLCKRRQPHAHINLIFYGRGHTNFIDDEYLLQRWIMNLLKSWKNMKWCSMRHVALYVSSIMRDQRYGI